MPSKKPVIRIGDKVQLLDPRPIARVGYDITVETLLEEVEKDEQVLSFCRSMRLDERATARVCRAVAAGRLAKSKHSGAERKIFYQEPNLSLKDQVLPVVSKHVRMTGRWQPGWYSRGYYGEDDYEPPYLSDAKTNVILGLGCGVWTVYGSSVPDREDYEWGLYVTTDQVRLVVGED